jgi:hypothetical protein
MTNRMTPPHLAQPDQLTPQLVLAELRGHRRTAGPFTWLDAITIRDRTASLAPRPGGRTVDAALQLLERTGQIELTNLPLRMPRDDCAGDPTEHAGMISLHARLALTPHQTHQELDHYAAALRTIAARLGHLLQHSHDEGHEHGAPRPRRMPCSRSRRHRSDSVSHCGAARSSLKRSTRCGTGWATRGIWRSLVGRRRRSW